MMCWLGACLLETRVPSSDSRQKLRSTQRWPTGGTASEPPVANPRLRQNVQNQSRSPGRWGSSVANDPLHIPSWSRLVLSATFPGSAALPDSLSIWQKYRACWLQSSIRLGVLPGAHVHAEAVVEGAGIHFVAHHPSQRACTCGMACRSLASGALGPQHLVHLRCPLDNRPSAQKVLTRGYPGADACHDGLCRVITHVCIEVAAHSVVTRLLGHHDLHIHVIIPLVHGHAHAKGKVHVHNTLLVALRNHIRDLPLVIVPQGEPRARVRGREACHHRLPIDGEHPALTGSNLDLVPMQERPTHHNPVRGGQPLGVLGALEATLDDNGAAFNDVEVSIAVEAGSLVFIRAHLVEGDDVRIAPENAHLRHSRRLRRRHCRRAAQVLDPAAIIFLCRGPHLLCEAIRLSRGHLRRRRAAELFGCATVLLLRHGPLFLRVAVVRLCGAAARRCRRNWLGKKKHDDDNHKSQESYPATDEKTCVVRLLWCDHVELTGTTAHILVRGLLDVVAAASPNVRHHWRASWHLATAPCRATTDTASDNANHSATNTSCGTAGHHAAARDTTTTTADGATHGAAMRAAAAVSTMLVVKHGGWTCPA